MTAKYPDFTELPYGWAHPVCEYLPVSLHFVEKRCRVCAGWWQFREIIPMLSGEVWNCICRCVPVWHGNKLYLLEMQISGLTGQFYCGKLIIDMSKSGRLSLWIRRLAHLGNKMTLWPSYFHSRIIYTCMMISLCQTASVYISVNPLPPCLIFGST